MSITVLFLVQLEGHREPHCEVQSQGPADRISGTRARYLLMLRHGAIVPLSVKIEGQISCPFPVILKNKCDRLRDLVSFVQFKQREKHLWSIVTFSKVEG